MQEYQIYLALFRCLTWIFILNRIQATVLLQDRQYPEYEDLEVWQRRDTAATGSEESETDGLTCEKPDVYICEEPPDTVSPDATKTCNYRNVNYHEQVYRWVAGRGCLVFTPGFLYVAGYNNINLRAACRYGHLFAPCLELAKEDGTCGCYPFDPGLEEVAVAVRQALIPAAQDRWERCFYAASDCCSHFMKEATFVEEKTNTTKNCETTFDAWTCWHGAEGGTVASEVCSEFAYSNTGPSCHHFSSKHCYENGTWEENTDFTTCSITQRLHTRYRYYIGVLAFSIAACMPAVFIFFFYKRLRITRVILHRNLLISIVIRNLLVIVSRSEIYIDELTSTGETVMSANGIACQILAFAERFAGNAVFVCMLVEGVYLHRTIVTVFRQKLKIRLLYAIGFVIALAPAIAWATVMAVYNNHSCWLVYTMDNIQWILDGPRVIILLVNTVLFIDVLRVLLTKLRNSENTNQLSTTKATLFLMPLFGTQFLLTAFRPNTTVCSLEELYYYVAYTIEGLQGFIVAMLFCYVNKEVHVLIKATYKKTENAVVSRIRGDSIYPQATSGSNDGRRMTYTTGLPPNQNDEVKDQYTEMKPKLHVAEIVSLDTNERLAEILEPVYETIGNGVTNKGYDSSNDPEADNDSGIIPNRESKEEDYGFTNASSDMSIDCSDWIRCVSAPSSTVYDNSLNDYETQYLEKKFPNNHKHPQNVNQEYFEDEDIEAVETGNPDAPRGDQVSVGIDNEYENLENNDMLKDILEYIETNEKPKLDPDNLSPNRKDEDKIIFIND